jgi:hypothetical protein
MLTFNDFATLGTHLHIISQMTYSRILQFIEQVKKIH